MRGSVVVASHNVMHGRGIEALIPHYVALGGREGLDLLCIQEDRANDGGALPSSRIATALGGSYDVVTDERCPGLAFVYDTRRLAAGVRDAVPLPRLASLAPIDRLILHGGRTKQRHVLIAVMQTRDPAAASPPLGAACFHLDVAGGTPHRLAQMGAIAAALAARGLHRRFVASGDTNAFAWRRQPATLRRLLAPLDRFGATDHGTRPTHSFGRQDEPGLLNRAGVLAGKLGLDLRHRLDVVCTNLPVVAHGQTITPASDHDLIWSRVQLSGGDPQAEQAPGRTP